MMTNCVVTNKMTCCRLRCPYLKSLTLTLSDAEWWRSVSSLTKWRVAGCSARTSNLWRWMMTKCVVTNRMTGCRLRCPYLKSLTLSDGEYYELVKSNFERADRMKVVRTTTNYTTSIVSLLTNYNDLLFNWTQPCNNAKLTLTGTLMLLFFMACVLG